MNRSYHAEPITSCFQIMPANGTGKSAQEKSDQVRYVVSRLMVDSSTLISAMMYMYTDRRCFCRGRIYRGRVSRIKSNSTDMMSWRTFTNFYGHGHDKPATVFVGVSIASRHMMYHVHHESFTTQSQP
jgi:hypothetical protein